MTGEFPWRGVDPLARPSWPEIQQALDSLRERVARLEQSARPGVSPDRAESPPPADADLQAHGIVQDILSIPSSGLHPDELFTLAMDRTSRLLSADRAMLFVVEAGGARLVPRSAHGFRRDDLETIALQPAEGIVGRAFKERRVLTYSTGGEGEAPDDFIERFPVWAAIAVPVRAEDEVAGVLYAGRRRFGAPFGADDVLRLLVIADRVGGGLVHQALLDRRARQVARLEELAKVTEQIAEAPALPDVLARACEAGCRLVDVRAAVVAMPSGGHDLELLAARGLPDEMEGWRRLDGREGLTAELRAGTRPIACRDVQARGVPARSVLGDGGFHGCLLLPLRFGDRAPAGVLYLADTEVRDFSAEEIEAAEVLAAIASAAIEHGRSSGELRAVLERVRATQEHRFGTERARILGEMAGGLARELNNIFAVILGKSRLLLAHVHDEPLREGLDLLEGAAWRGADVVRRLNALAAPASGEATGSVEMTAVVQDALALTRPRWNDEQEGRNARIEVVTDLRSVPPVAANAAALRDAVVNLVVNAVDAMPHGGRLTVVTRPRDGGVELTVEDTGEGIPDDVQGRVFDPFFTTRSPQRMGLGLTVAHGVITQYGGRLHIASVAGHGTTVSAWLPGAEAPAAVTGAADNGGVDAMDAGVSGSASEKIAAVREGGPAVLPPPSEAASILVLEDEGPVRALLVDALVQAGHKVETATDGPSGLARLEAAHFDVVLVDLALPQRSGLAIARAVKRLSPQTPVILITGWGHLLDPQRLREHGVDLMLVKPFRLERVLSVVTDALRLRFPA